MTWLGLIDAEYTRHPFYGSRTILQYLRGVGYPINRKRVQRLMGVLGFAGLAPGPNTSRPYPQHAVHPYVLRVVVVTGPNRSGLWILRTSASRVGVCVYLVAVIDGSLRTVLAWRVSNTLDHGFCVERLWRSVKCKDIDLRGYATLPELLAGLMDYFVWYNTERRHQSWDDVIPDEVYRTASGGGARIVDQFGKTEHMPPDTQQETERRGSAVPLHGTGYPLTLKA